MNKFEKENLSEEEIKQLEKLSNLCCGDILTMTTLAKSGHPGGAMSSLELLLAVYSFANYTPSNAQTFDRDKVIISHGHISAGVYSVLGRLGFFDIDMANATFRLSGSLFEGHVVRTIPGVDWGTGNLGQGLSAGCGFALADIIHKRKNHVFVLMSDGEQTKGQIAEARRFAAKYGLGNITVLIDFNKIQISGATCDVMPCRLKENYLADNWEVLEINGHDFSQIYQAMRHSLNTEKPVCILADTIIGNGISFMEGKYKYHGQPLDEAEYNKAFQELGLPDNLSKYKELRKQKWDYPKQNFSYSTKLEKGTPVLYGSEEKTDNRSAYGKALSDIARANKANPNYPIAVFDCDLATSVKTADFAKEFPERFFQIGVQEHNAVTIAGAVSVDNITSFFSDFGVFGVDETYNQHRLNDQNYTNVKTVCTHIGLDVGEDGKTHQCIDYVGLFRNLYNFKIVLPADPNQTDRVIRHIADKQGNWFVGMGRFKRPVILKEDGRPYFDETYQFEYGKADVIREGKNGYILTMGCLAPGAVEAHERLKELGIEIGIMNYCCPVTEDNENIEKAISTGLIITYEDHNRDTGLGATIALALSGRNYTGKFLRLGVKRYGSSGEPDFLFKREGLDPDSVVQQIRDIL